MAIYNNYTVLHGEKLVLANHTQPSINKKKQTKAYNKILYSASVQKYPKNKRVSEFVWSEIQNFKPSTGWSQFKLATHPQWFQEKPNSPIL